MNIAGVTAHGSDSSVALFRGGRLIAAAREESFSRERGDNAFPTRALRYCLGEARLQPGDLDAVVFPEKPLRRFERVLATELSHFPRSSGAFAREMFRWLGGRLWIKNELSAEIGIPAERVLFVERHRALAAATQLQAPFDRGRVLVTDAEGEWATTSWFDADGGALRPAGEVHHPHALSRLFAAISAFLAIQGDDAEARLFGLAGHGSPSRVDALRPLIRVLDDGGFELAMDELKRFGEPGVNPPDALVERLGEARHSGDPLRYRGEDRADADLARSLCELLGDIAVALVAARPPDGDACGLSIAGELASWPGVLRRVVVDGPYERVFALPISGGAAAALGAAMVAARERDSSTFSGGVSLACGPEAVESDGDRDGASTADPTEVAGRLADGEVVGWLHGRLELSRSTHGGRSLLAHPGRADAAAAIRGSIKRSEDFVPFPCAVSEERIDELFDLSDRERPLLTRRVIPVRVRDAARERLAGVVHADGTCLARTVSPADEPDLDRLLAAFESRTGTPALLETTLRLAGEPMVIDRDAAARMMERSTLETIVVDGGLQVGVGEPAPG